jgi:hypothetical protein
MRVFVYRNIRKGNFSVKALEGPSKGLVIHRGDTVHLAHAKPRVSESGRLRVLRDKQKNVHAGIVGVLTGCRDGNADMSGYQCVSYNPYRGPSFTYPAGGTYTGSIGCILTSGKVYPRTSKGGIPIGG